MTTNLAFWSPKGKLEGERVGRGGARLLVNLAPPPDQDCEDGPAKYLF